MENSVEWTRRYIRKTLRNEAQIQNDWNPKEIKMSDGQNCLMKHSQMCFSKYDEKHKFVDVIGSMRVNLKLWIKIYQNVLLLIQCWTEYKDVQWKCIHAEKNNDQTSFLRKYPTKFIIMYKI